MILKFHLIVFVTFSGEFNQIRLWFMIQVTNMSCSRWTNHDQVICLSLWPSGIGVHLGWNRLRVRVLAVSDTYPMFVEPTITQIPSGFCGYMLGTKLCWKKVLFNEIPQQMLVLHIECISLWQTILDSMSRPLGLQVAKQIWFQPTLGEYVNWT